MLIETAAGMHRVDEIAAACPERMEAMVFGVADYAASLQSHTTSIGGSTDAYAVRTDAGALHWGDQWHYPLARIAVACRAHGLRPIDGPYGDFGDPEGYRVAARRAAVLGYEGKWAIHPSQIALANDVFTPDAAAAEKTRRIIAAMAEAAREGRGAVSLDGRLIDAASLRMAETPAAQARADRGARERRAGGRASAAERPHELARGVRRSGPIAPAHVGEPGCAARRRRPRRASSSPAARTRISSASATVSAARSRIAAARRPTAARPSSARGCGVTRQPVPARANPMCVRFARPSAVWVGRNSVSSIRSALCVVELLVRGPERRARRSGARRSPRRRCSRRCWRASCVA